MAHITHDVYDAISACQYLRPDGPERSCVQHQWCTRIGSPYVIEAMHMAMEQGQPDV